MSQYEIGAAVVYDVYGVCKVNDIKMMSFSPDKKKENYYVLSPVNSCISTYYVPVNNEKLSKKLRSPMTREEICDLLTKAKECEYSWIDNRQLRSDSCHRILNSGICPELIALIKCFFERKTELSEKGKSLSATDESVFSAAEKLITEEFSYSLGIDGQEVSGYIRKYFESKN